MNNPNNITNKKLTDDSYQFTAEHNGSSFNFTTKVNEKTGTWNIPSFNQKEHPTLARNQAAMAHKKLVQFLKQNPPYSSMKKLGQDGKMMFQQNKGFSL